MEQNQNPLAPGACPERSLGAATDEPASPLNLYDARAPANTPDEPGFNVPLLSDCLNESLSDTLADTFPPGGRKPRHDGWTPEKIGGFLRHLAASGIVDHAARSVGLSASSAYAFRNRRQGRAFARMWDAILIHRARARVAGENQARAIAGCVSRRVKDGEVVSEYHYYDNRLAMAMLTRLDRLAEEEAESEAHLRALSEDLDEFIECVAAGGDADAFVEARKPPPEEEEWVREIERELEAERLETERGEDEELCDEIVVWHGSDGWWTSFPPPEGFDGDEEGEPGEADYKRRLSEAEQAAVDADEAAARIDRLARDTIRRDEHFGFEGGLRGSRVSFPMEAEPSGPSDAGGDSGAAPPGPEAGEG